MTTNAHEAGKVSDERILQMQTGEVPLEMTEAERASYWQGAYERMASRNMAADAELERALLSADPYRHIRSARACLAGRTDR